jgi:peptidyl-prolyl cis-trans isomerase D
LLESFRKGQRWLTLIFVSVIGLVFVFFFGSGGSGFGPATPGGNTVVQLDDVKLTNSDFFRERRNTESRLRQQLGEAYDQVGADRYLDSQALSTLINSVVLAAAADDMGLHVTTDEVRRVVQTFPAFIDQDGRFSPVAFNNFAEREYGTQREFIRSFTRSLLGQKLIQVLGSQTTVSDAEIDLQTRYELDEVRIAYVALDDTLLPDGESVTDEELEAYAVANENDLRARFNERFEELSTPERLQARHILVQLSSEATEEEVVEARARAESAHARVVAGEDFAVVASEVSEDAGTSASGGDLGLFARGENDPALDEAAFALEPGGLSEVVRSPYGFHVIRVDEKQAAVDATFETARNGLAQEGATLDRARELAEINSQALAERVTEGNSLEDAARLAGLTLERPPGLKRRPDGFVPGLGAAGDLLTTAFILEAGQSSPEIFDIGGRRVLIQVLERNLADEETVLAQRADRRADVLTEKQNRTLDAWLGQYRRDLERSGRLFVNAELAIGNS